MKPTVRHELLSSNHLGCFGRFRSTDPICRRHCAICIRCAAETEQRAQAALWEGFFAEEDIATHIH